MTFFLDENFPKLAVQFLNQRGHVTFDIRGTEHEGIDDFAIFRMAKEQSAIFLTCDRDFYHTIHLTEKPHYGIIVITLRRPNASAIIDKLQWVIENLHKFTFTDECILLTDTKCTIYR